MTLTLDMATANQCSSASDGVPCPQVFFVDSDHNGNVLKITKCAYHKVSADYTGFSFVYTFINIAATNGFAVFDDNEVSTGYVPPGGIIECQCLCLSSCTT